MTKVITFKNRKVPVHYPTEHKTAIQMLHNKLREMEFNFDFRRKWKRIASVEMVRDVAILQYNDGTKLYMEVS
ncbi:hypothetical protein [Paenibacillus methanolicus]|uniref:Uncharacterized protein n=1 Tax=Paenibacillus methanolicus TaxID=582686 RepID=A0A5S5BU67_9BACL|nr:hypothetical protein [Paenibacillus methanolicus]TYP70715.1 hypothetical protein BCM02_111222 [Paenibacillus methanolicus]